MNVDDYIARKTAGASASDIEEGERVTGYRFGAELRALLLASNGGDGTRVKLVLPDRSATGGFEYLSTDNMIRQWRRAELTDAHIPFVRDAGGNLLVADRDGLVSFWDQSFAKLVDLGFRIDELPARAQPVPPDPPADLAEVHPLAGPLLSAIESGADPSSVVRQERDARVLSQFLSVAVSLDSPELVRVILAHSKSGVSDSGLGVGHALNLAARRSRIEIVEAFLAEGVDIDARDHRGRTPLMAVASGGAADMVDWLLAHGADPHATDAQGLTAKVIAARAQHRDIAGKLP